MTIISILKSKNDENAYCSFEARRIFIKKTNLIVSATGQTTVNNYIKIRELELPRFTSTRIEVESAIIKLKTNAPTIRINETIKVMFDAIKLSLQSNSIRCSLQINQTRQDEELEILELFNYHNTL